MAKAPSTYVVCRYNEYAHVEQIDGYGIGFTRRTTCPFARGDRGDIKWTHVGFFRATVPDLPPQYNMHAVSVIDITYLDEFACSPP